MGLLDSVLGGSRVSGGGMSPITMALMGLLAYRTFQGTEHSATGPHSYTRCPRLQQGASPLSNLS
jgi:hypothetical protein